MVCKKKIEKREEAKLIFLLALSSGEWNSGYDDIRYRCNDIDECRKSNDVEQERIARVNLVIMMTDIDEKTFKALNQLEQAIVDYIDYYNNKRIKVKLKGLSPVQYRTKSFT